MNIQELFSVVKQRSGEHALVAVVRESERQGYAVTAAGRFHGSLDVTAAGKAGELDNLPIGIGIPIQVTREAEAQTFLIHFLDLDAICFTDVNSPPVIYDPGFTIDEFRPDEQSWSLFGFVPSVQLIERDFRTKQRAVGPDRAPRAVAVRSRLELPSPDLIDQLDKT